MPSERKRRRSSGPHGADYLVAELAIKRYIAKIHEDHALRTEEIPEEELAKLRQLEGVVQMLNSKHDAPQVLAAQPINGSI